MTEDFANLNQEAIGIWEQMAPWWDSHMGEDGNRTHRSLVAPTTERLLDISAGRRYLRQPAEPASLRGAWQSWEPVSSPSTHQSPS